MNFVFFLLQTYLQTQLLQSQFLLKQLNNDFELIPHQVPALVQEFPIRLVQDYFFQQLTVSFNLSRINDNYIISLIRGEVRFNNSPEGVSIFNDPSSFISLAQPLPSGYSTSFPKVVSFNL